MNNRIQIGDYGVVKIVKGEFAGRFGYYDDDEIGESEIDDCEEYLDSKAIVYFGSLLDNSKYYCIDYGCLSKDYTFEDLKKRKTEIELKF